MSPVFALILTALEVSLTAFAYLTRTQGMFADVVIYGSPFYLVMNAFKPGSPFTDGPKIYLVYAAFHVVKYITLFRARLSDELRAASRTAIVLEIAYLAISAYYLY